MIKKLQHRKLVARMCRGEKKFTIHPSDSALGFNLEIIFAINRLDQF